MAFNLTKNYSIASLLGIALVATFLGYFYWNWAYDSLKKQETESNTNLTRALANDMWPRYAEFIAGASSLSSEQLASHPNLALIREELVSKLRGLRVAKVKIYNLDGLTVFSTEASQVGENKSENHGFLLAKAGNIASEITYRNQFSHYDSIIENRNVLSSYIPVRQSASGPVVGVFEVYSDVTTFINEIKQTRYRVFGLVAGLLVLLYLFLLVFIRKADHIIRVFQQEEVNKATFYDPVTALPNRSGFEKLLLRSLEEAGSNEEMLAVFSINIDRFKLVNESLGNRTGDILLRETGKRLQSVLRREDIVSRIAADEFSIIVKGNASVDQIILMAERVTASFAEPVTIDTHNITITTSIGIAIYPVDTNDSTSLARYASTAMHKAKSSGGNQYVFYTEELNAETVKRFDLEMGLRNAIRNDEFVLYYQPRVNMTTGQVLGMEALLRWQTANGLMPPGDFIPVLEDTGMIVDVGRWIIYEACRQCREWHKMGYDNLRVSVNLSARQFNDNQLLWDIKDALRKNNLPARNLEVEITESILASNTQRAITVLGELKSMGVYISIDDFGTGYSSLSYLMLFPVDYLKIDRSFVTDVTCNARHANLTRAIIAMATSMGLETVAEGIENVQQLDFVREEKCTEAQGFLYSKPLPANEFIRTVKIIDQENITFSRQVPGLQAK